MPPAQDFFGKSLYCNELRNSAFPAGQIACGANILKKALQIPDKALLFSND
jgi:hypothetical protein